MDITRISKTDELLSGGRSSIAAGSQLLSEENYEHLLDIDPVPTEFQIASPSDPSDIDVYADEFGGQNVNEALLKTGFFVLGYSGRLVRAALAWSGTTTLHERWNDVRDEEGFWAAHLDRLQLAKEMAKSIVPSKTMSSGFLTGDTEQSKELTRIFEEQKKSIGPLLTDPMYDEYDIPGIGAMTEEVGVPIKMSWIFDILGEILIERRVGGAARVSAKKAFAKMAGKAYDDTADLAIKGSKSIFGSLDDADIIALDEARRIKRYGTLGTKPPQADIDDAITRTMDYIAQSAPAKLTKEQTIHAKRVAGAARIRQATGEGYGVGYYPKLRKAGGTTKTDPSFVPFVSVDPDAENHLKVLQSVADNHEYANLPYTSANIHEALHKLYVDGELLTTREVELLRDTLGSNFANALKKFTDLPKEGLAKGVYLMGKGLDELSASAAALKTTGELSHLMRQLNHRFWTRPRAWTRSAFVSLRSMFSGQYAEDINAILLRHGQDASRYGLRLNRYGDVSSALREEHFRTSILREIPIIKKYVNKYLDVFERAYVNGINVARLDWFDEGAEIIKRSGKWSDELGEYVVDDRALTEWADVVNNMTGWADITAMGEAAKMEKLVSVANKTMLAPRFSFSRINKHRAYAKAIFGDRAPKALKEVMIRDTFKKWLAINKVMQYAESEGYEVGVDFRSADMLHIKKGNTRIDLLGGDMQIPVLLTRLATGQTKDTHTGEIKDAIRRHIIQQYLSGKLSPMMSVGYDYFIAQQTFEGKDINDPKVFAAEFADQFMQLFAKDMIEFMRDQTDFEQKSVQESLTSALPVAALGFIGEGIKTYQPSARQQIDDIYSMVAYSEYGTPYWKLSPEQKRMAELYARSDYDEKLRYLETEAGMGQMSPGAAAKMQEKKNRSARKIRGLLGEDYSIFIDANVQPGGLSPDVGSVRLNQEQYDRYHDLYAGHLKRNLMENIDSVMYLTGEDLQYELQYIVDVSKEDAAYDIMYGENGVKLPQQ